MNEESKSGFFTPFEKGKDLLCASPSDTEDFLKECKNGRILTIPLCTYEESTKWFHCDDPKGIYYKLETSQADNFFCLSQQDRKRLLYRCESPID